MDRRFKSITVLILLLLLLGVSEARPLHNPLPEEEVTGIFRTLKKSGPSSGGGHRVKKVQNFGGMKDSGPSSGGGHRFETAQGVGMVKQSGPSPGQGHKIITGNHS